MTRSYIQGIKIVALCAGLSACASVNGFPDRVNEDPVSRLNSLQSKYFLPTVDVLDVYKSTATADKASYRNQVVYGRLLALDLQFAVFQKGLYKEGIMSNLTLDMVGLGLGAAGGLVGESTSQILSALSGGVAGARASINKNLYYERTLPALLALMVAQRETKLTEIYRGLQQDVDLYPMGQALADLERYYYAGTIPGAVATLTEEAGKTQADAKEEKKALLKSAYVDIGLQQKIKQTIGKIDTLNTGAALQLLTSPPVPFTANEVALLNRAYAGGLAARLAAGTISDAQAIAGLKRLLALTAQRTDISALNMWIAAIDALQKP